MNSRAQPDWSKYKRELEGVCVYVCVVCMWEREREIYEKESALAIMEAENIPRNAVN